MTGDEVLALVPAAIYPSLSNDVLCCIAEDTRSHHKGPLLGQIALDRNDALLAAYSLITIHGGVFTAKSFYRSLAAGGDGFTEHLTRFIWEFAAVHPTEPTGVTLKWVFDEHAPAPSMEVLAELFPLLAGYPAKSGGVLDGSPVETIPYARRQLWTSWWALREASTSSWVHDKWFSALIQVSDTCDGFARRRWRHVLLKRLISDAGNDRRSALNSFAPEQWRQWLALCETLSSARDAGAAVDAVLAL